MVESVTLALGSFVDSSALGAIGVLAVRKGHLDEVSRGLALGVGTPRLVLADARLYSSVSICLAMNVAMPGTVKLIRPCSGE